MTWTTHRTKPGDEVESPLAYLPTWPDLGFLGRVDRMMKIDEQRTKARREFNRKGADALGRQLVAARRKLLNSLARGSDRSA